MEQQQSKTPKPSTLNFFEQVYEIVRLIPPGRVTSYGAIARALGAASSSRMVGWAMNDCHRYDPTIPAHRVVNHSGLLTGKHHFETPDMMEKLLLAEGISVRNNKVEKFKELFWDPTIELTKGL